MRHQNLIAGFQPGIQWQNGWRAMTNDVGCTIDLMARNRAALFRVKSSNNNATL